MLTKQRTQNPDFTDLQNEVMDLWDDQGIEYTRTENVGFTPPDPAFYETSILPEFETLLSNPLWCVNQLGFDSLASYIASKREEEQLVPISEIALREASKVAKGFDNIISEIESTFSGRAK